MAGDGCWKRIFKELVDMVGELLVALTLWIDVFV